MCWYGMKKRCLDHKHKAYMYYGGRGISVCERWMNFNNFLEDMGTPNESDTLERIDNNLGYLKENCKWATMKEQSSNKRNLLFFTIEGITKTLPQWSIFYKKNNKVVYERIFHLGWSLDQALGLSEKPNRKPKTHCKRGHKLTEENLIYRKNGDRRCKTCNILSKKEYYLKNKEI